MNSAREEDLFFEKEPSDIVYNSTRKFIARCLMHYYCNKACNGKDGLMKLEESLKDTKILTLHPSMDVTMKKINIISPDIKNCSAEEKPFY
mmetsp:Transcript_1867/g.2555  ORF Transcript_1867/g.2555 Transcript_1867/m.2555 type:complete len:91 (-) Transcript_1867:110-382(-)